MGNILLLKYAAWSASNLPYSILRNDPLLDSLFSALPAMSQLLLENIIRR